MAHQIYRGTKIGSCLCDSLLELVESGKITEDVAEEVLNQFDKSVCTALDAHIQTKATLKGNLKTYRYLDNVWEFFLEGVELKLNTTGRTGGADHVNMDTAKLVCVDSKLVQKEKEEWEGNERDAELQRMQSQQSQYCPILPTSEPDVVPGTDEDSKGPYS